MAKKVKKIKELTANEMAYRLIGILDCSARTADFKRMVRNLRTWRTGKG